MNQDKKMGQFYQVTQNKQMSLIQDVTPDKQVKRESRFCQMNQEKQVNRVSQIPPITQDKQASQFYQIKSEKQVNRVSPTGQGHQVGQINQMNRTKYIQELHEKAQKIAKDYLRQERELLEIITQIEEKRLYFQLGYNSLFAYVSEALQLSPAVTYNFIKVARKTLEVPELKEEVMKGKLSISKAQKMTSVLTRENHKEWFEVAQNNSHQRLERQVALASPQSSVEKTQYVHPTNLVPEKVQLKKKGKPQEARVALQLGLSESVMLKLRKVQDLESQRQKRNVNLEEVMAVMAELYLEKKDPLRKAKRQQVREKLKQELAALPCSRSERDEDGKTSQVVRDLEKSVQDSMPNVKGLEKGKTSQGVRDLEKGKSDFTKGEISLKPQKPGDGTLQGRASLKKKRKNLPAELIHEIYLRDEGGCAYKDSKGKTCSSRRYLEIHHIKPLSQGGEDRLDNLTLLCSGHHKTCHLHL